MKDITLQINLSPGDVNYAQLTVPALCKHHEIIEKKLLIVDRCRPQRTKLVDPDQRFPEEKFKLGVEEITEISENLLRRKAVTDIYYLDPNDPYIAVLSKKYLRSIYKTTHSAGGTANMSYWLAMELPQTRYVLHYDGDIVLYQKPGYNWTDEAISYMQAEPDVLMAVPRLCPPLNKDNDIPSLHEGRPIHSYTNFWKNDWFSTRHFLLDKERLNAYLPLVRGRIMTELLLRKYGNRAFPIDPEILLHRSAAPRGAKRLVLKNENAWLLHPTDKSQAFLNILPQLIKTISMGKSPEKQRGFENIITAAWEEYAIPSGTA
jgi:hypothetical protein